MKLEFSPQIFEKTSDIKLHQHLSSGSCVDPCRQIRYAWMDITKLTVAFCNFANAPKNCSIKPKIFIADT